MAHKSFDPALPVYRGDALRRAYQAGEIATRTELRAVRLRLAEGQSPVAQYWTGYEWVRVYRVAEAVPMKPLTPKQQARRAAARTCARCGAHRTSEPFERDPRTRRRVCVDCTGVEREVHWWRIRNVDRRLAEKAAQQLLDDPTTLLWACETDLPYGRRSAGLAAAAAVDAAGQTVFAAEVMPPGRDLPGRSLSDVEAQLRGLAGRPIVPWRTYAGDLAVYARQELKLDLEVGRHVIVDADDHVVMATVSDVAMLWLGRPRTDRSVCPHAYAWIGVDDFPAGPPMHITDPQLTEVANQCAARAHRYLEVLRVIASGDHPDGPARCPERFRRDELVCGSTDLTVAGLCAAHTEGYPNV